ncbi:hypothetical protein [Paenibacillus sp.]|uniref:hypothetical protein n=1 Tax=Paenibacillus sp. TaxID=58172 RepID=UPI002D6D239C|nr:hypothetical protein [Paenibacillus sp.]HZG86329.1 hypothetical protein [Paenibacillus sp.]
MSKRLIFVFLAAAVFLTACGGNASWETEEVVETSDRIMADMVQANWTVREDGANGTLVAVELKTKDGEPIESFDLNHEKLLHLIVISEDLSYFAHLHPEYRGSGVFEIHNEFPAGGNYRFIADFKPTGGDSMTKMAWNVVEGEPAAPAPIAPSAELADSESGRTVELTLTELGANRETTLTFAIADEASGAPVTDLEPYLGAIGHVVVLSADGERYVHVHAEGDQGTGPEARFEATFPTGGIYKIWAQFQQNGEVFSVDYVVQVPE